MADYTPTTDEMADAYVQMRVREARGETGGERILTAIDALSEFEQGMAEHDRQVKAEALRETADSLMQSDDVAWPSSWKAWLRARADRIEADQ